MDILITVVGAVIGTGLLAGLLSKVLGISYGEILRRVERRGSARRFVGENLDPVLKSADELFGKLRSLAAADFDGIQNPRKSAGPNLDLLELLYFLVKFWASIEIFRKKGLSVSIAADDRGKKLSHFLDSLESRKIRFVDRLTQRVLAELLLEAAELDPQKISFLRFMRMLGSSDEAQAWMEQVSSFLFRTGQGHTRDRQKLLAYGAVLHAMIDTLDPRHRVSHERSSYPEKLSKKTWRDLRYRVFGRYLDFVKNTEKYLGPPKRR